MTIFRTTKMAFKSILHNKMRSILTMLGIIIGCLKYTSPSPRE